MPKADAALGETFARPRRHRLIGPLFFGCVLLAGHVRSPTQATGLGRTKNLSQGPVTGKLQNRSAKLPTFEG